ncbi:hypothetical protein P4E94_17660 [Pontiellaceae bacterium B12219]|nr:hypothetical protein [Pontiellaceae bacterium B12219]
MPAHRKIILNVISNLLLGTLCVLTSALVIKFDAGAVINGSKFGESSATETAQLVYLFLTALLFGVVAVRSKTRRGIATLMSGGVAAMMIREMDGWLDSIFHGAWFPLAAGVMLISIFLAMRFRDQLLDNIGEFILSPVFGAFVAACLGIFVFSRLFGMKVLWESFFDVQHLAPMQRWVKNAVEEGSELFGYTLLFLSSYGFLRYVKLLEAKELVSPLAAMEYTHTHPLTDAEARTL